MMLDAATLAFVAANLRARALAELLMRDAARREGRAEIAALHADRAGAFQEAAAAVPLLRD